MVNFESLKDLHPHELNTIKHQLYWVCENCCRYYPIDVLLAHYQNFEFKNIPCPNCENTLFPVDEDMVKAVIAFNKLGYKTVSACAGHLAKQAEPSIILDRNEKLLTKTWEFIKRNNWEDKIMVIENAQNNPNLIAFECRKTGMEGKLFFLNFIYSLLVHELGARI